MNIIKIQDQLKNAPDDALVGYVQNPTGHVPTYLALSELQRRKEMRNSYQANKPEEKTVAEDLVQEAQPQPQMPQEGVAGLPEAQPMMEAMAPPPEMPMQQMAQGGIAELDTGDMFDEANYAQGGIVAFADGGDTGMNVEGSGSLNVNRLPSLNVNTGTQGSQFLRMGPADAAAAELLKLITRGNLSEGPFGSSIQTKGPFSGMAQGGEVQRFAGPDGSYVQSDDPYADMYSSDLERAIALKQYELDKKKRLKDKTFPGFLSTPPTKPEQFDINALVRKVNPIGGYVPTESPAKSDAQLLAEQNEKALKDKEKALKDMMKQNSGGAREKVRSLADYTNEFKNLVGTDPMQAKLAERLEKMDSRAAKMEEQAPWMALAQAGFEMASSRPEYGKGQSAFADIARGATAGIKSYSDAKDKMATLEEKRFGLVADMAKAQRAEQLAIASKGIDSREAALAREQQDRIHQQDQALKLQLSILDNTYELQKTAMTTAAKDLPTAVDRATKIDPLVIDDKDYKEGLKALEDKYGDKGVIPGSPNHGKYQADVEKLYRQVYTKKIRNPLAASSSSADLNYVPGKGFSF